MTHPQTPPAVEPLPATARVGEAALAPLRWWNRHRLEGAEHVPRVGPAIGCLNHSLATYDLFLFGLALHAQTGRMTCALGDDNLFRIPGLASVVHASGIRPASHAHGKALLAEGRVVFIAPGGTREALRPSSERYRIRWDRRTGFARLAVETGVPVLLAACPAADDLYTVYANPLTAQAYKAFRWPVPIVRGFGPTLLPRPVPLVHRIAPPMQPPPLEPDRLETQVRDFHADCVRRMRSLMDEVRRDTEAVQEVG